MIVMAAAAYRGLRGMPARARPQPTGLNAALLTVGSRSGLLTSFAGTGPRGAIVNGI